MQPEIATTAEGGLTEWARRLANRLHLPTTLVKFVIVGGIGFLINQFVLFLFYDAPVVWFLPDKHTATDLLLFKHTDVRLLIASVVAVEVAIVCQFNFHDRWTFRNRNREGNIVRRFLKFNLASIVSPVITVIAVNVLTPVMRDAAGEDSLIGHVAPYLSNTVGVAMGFIWNYTLNSLVIWPREREEAPAGS